MFIRTLHMVDAGGSHIPGIDLGTTNTVASVGGIALELNQGAEGRVVLPSVVAYAPSGACLVGTPARQRRVIDPANTLYSSKRVMGRAWASPEAEEYRRRYPFTMEKSADDGLAFVTRAGTFTPVDVAATLLKHVLSQVPRGVESRQCAIAVPATFGAPQRQATLDAAHAAGMEEAVVVDEPLAAAAAYSGRFQGGLVAVYDLGGGTFDFSILDCSKTPFEVLANDGDPFLGGDDLDHALADWAVLEVLKGHRVDLRTDKEAYDRLVGACEAAKIRLSYTPQAHVDLSQVDPALFPEDAHLELDVTLLNRLVGDLVRRTFVICEEVLRRAGQRQQAIRDVVLAGGSTQLPTVRAGLERFFGRPPRAEISPTQVVSIGAGLAGRRMLTGQSP